MGPEADMRLALAFVCTMLALLSACRPAARSEVPDSLEALPATLEDWQVFKRDGAHLRLREAFVPYDLNSALFSDYAHKLRAIRVPQGRTIRYGRDKFVFPVGTVIAKTFYYPRTGDGDTVAKVAEQSAGDSLELHSVRLIETRLLINTRSGWIAAPYVWNEEQTQAHLQLAGDSTSMTLVDANERESFEYQVPDVNQCAACHAADHEQQILEPIGVLARQLNKEYEYSFGTRNQLEHWSEQKMLSGAPRAQHAPRTVQWAAAGELDARARAYLDVNCAHCHSAEAAANTSGLLLEIERREPAQWGVCKIPVASGRGSGNAAFDIVPGDPDRSILLYRMTSTEADIAMPELGRSVVHEEGVALIREWIASMSGNCGSL
jgi:uncharacterized repeat protein (TIGR03806 family)